MIPLQQLINNYLREEEAKQAEIRKEKVQTTWHSSDLGSCMRGTYLKRLGEIKPTPLTDRNLRVFHKGKMEEQWLVDLIEKQGKIKIDTQVRIENEALNLSGYADFVIENEEGKEVCEVKSKHSGSFWYMTKGKEGASFHHKMQLWSYLYSLGVEKGRIIYLSKDDCSVLEYPVELQDVELKEAVTKELELLNKAWKEKNPSLLPLPEDKAWQAKYCRFHEHCKKI